MTSVPSQPAGILAALEGESPRSITGERLRSVSEVKGRQIPVPVSLDATLRPTISRSYSCDNWENYLSACDELENRLQLQKIAFDTQLAEDLETLVPELQSLHDDEGYQSTLDRLVEIIQEVIDMTTADLMQGCCGDSVKKLLHLQQSWNPAWPKRIAITQTLLKISSLSRVANFLVGVLLHAKLFTHPVLSHQLVRKTLGRRKT